MIWYWVDAAGRFGIADYLATRAQPLAELVQVREYERLAAVQELTGGAHIFSALDQLMSSQRDAVAAIYDQLSGRWPAVRLLNDPRRVSLRYDLLRKLFDAGINSFDARRATEATERLRFPVFVREESKHNGALTGLLESRRELARALIALRARGFRVADLLVVEFCDVSDDEGLYRKASAFKVGDSIIPGHLVAGHHWMLKWDGSEADERSLREDLAYIMENPHDAWLRRVFALADVDYGRVDYGVRGDTLQVWEINLNPTIGRGEGRPLLPFNPALDSLQHRARTAHHDRLQAAFRALEPVVDRTRVTVRISAALLARIRTEAARYRWRQAILRFLHGIYDHPTIGRPFRTFYSHVLARR